MQAVVLACVETGVPVVTRGAGTGLSGGANAVDGCVVLSIERMTAILEIDPVERLAVVQPGVVNDDLRAACAEHGLWYPPDPASAPWSTIGGNVATNAGGLCCVKYGVTARLRARARGRHRHSARWSGSVGVRPRAWRATTWSG